MQRSLRRFSPGSAAAAVGTSGSLGQEMADQNCEPLFDAWMRCLVNSECFAGAEGTTVYSPADTDDFVRPIGDVSAGVGAMKIE